ncbi:endo-1,3;1,4-beta-D-glucanase-like [Quercus robur]|uniref:endo-1,3;1,4-beta-D-glucanase-like n=1 Tax=Quercus robur TaxID=38942 RepID=UPI00216338AA|nr:endo-1,3;1,4-beta-D-glucanase-like [Quercus robur]
MWVADKCTLILTEGDSAKALASSRGRNISLDRANKLKKSVSFWVITHFRPPTLNRNAGAGHVEQLGGLSTYVSGSPNSKLAILLISDVYGYEAPNLRKLADKVAAAGFFVVVPDFFNGDPYVPDDANRPIQVWLKDHGTDKGFEEAKPVIEAVKSKGVSAVGAAGFCWGAKVVVELAKAEFIQAGVLCHPSFVTVDDIKGVKVPIAVLGAENDHLSPPTLLKQFEEALAAKPEVRKPNPYFLMKSYN